MLVSMVTGVMGGVAGGKLVAPMFGIVDSIPEAFSLAALVCTLAGAAVVGLKLRRSLVVLCLTRR